MNADQVAEIEALQQILTDASEFQIYSEGCDSMLGCRQQPSSEVPDAQMSVTGFFKVDFDIPNCAGDDGLTLEAYQLVRRNSVTAAENCSVDSVHNDLHAGTRRMSAEKVITSEKQPNKREKRALEAVEHAENVLYLPPVIVHFELPITYPNDAPPILSLSCSWLSKHHQHLLHDACIQQWKNVRGPIIFQLHSFFRHEALRKIFSVSETFKTLLLVPHRAFAAFMRNCNDANSDSSPVGPAKLEMSRKFRNVIACSDPVAALNTISAYNLRRKREVREQSMQECPVCFRQDKFTNGFELTLCKHWFCRQCVASYTKMHIKEGSVSFIKCLNDSCGKEIIAGDVQQVVAPDEFAKYDSTLLNVALSSMADVIYCPRKFCQAAVLQDPHDSDAQCPSCQFVFCLRCRRCNHGVNPCSITGDVKRLAQLYEEADAAERERLEKQYGRAHMLDAVHSIRSESWIESNSKQCPNCKSSTEKFDGCNKIACSKCGCYWCWLCLRVLDKADPYKHYRDRREGSCFQQLFRGMQHFDELGRPREHENPGEIENDAVEGEDDEDDDDFELFFDNGDGDDDVEGDFIRVNLMEALRLELEARGRGGAARRARR